TRRSSDLLAVTHEAPYLRFLTLHQPASAQVAIEARLVNRHDRAEPHRDGWELPEVRHQIRMRVRRKPAAFGEFLAKMLQMMIVQPSFEVCAGIIARRSVTLKINQIPGSVTIAAEKKMVQ